MNEHANIKSSELNTAQQVRFLLATRSSDDELAVEPVAATIIDTTATALRVALQAVHGRPRLIWLPRRALVLLERNGSAFTGRLANWFKPNEAQARAFGACVRSTLQLH